MKEAQKRAEEEAKLKNMPHIDNTRFSIFEETEYLRKVKGPYLSQNHIADLSVSETSEFAYDSSNKSL
jgi:hypothetical protein